MKGFLIFNGGEAFSPRCRQADHIWLQLIRTQRQRPRLVVVPTAETAKPRKVADQVMRYFNHLGTFAEYSMIINQQSANTHTEYEILNKVNAIVLTDGSPIDLVERLKNTKTEEALKRGVVERKVAVMATGASAMGLGAVYWFGGQWETGLGVAPHLAILPHHNLARMRLSPERLLEHLPEGITLIGVDDATTLICHPDGSYQVEGEGEVVVYRSAEQQDAYRSGKRFTLDNEQ